MAYYWVRIHEMEFAKCVCVGSCDVFAYIYMFHVNRMSRS